ncbi:arginyltransferase [Candidatus Electronema sp. JM]|uniref:arginyltransferase n=1 Tax=Candidatus Electronema sp. JM TaxID=3401571 RepID=UPI003AA862E5
MMRSTAPNSMTGSRSKLRQEKQSGLTTGRIGKNLEQYFTDIATHCPYELPFKAVYHQAMFGSLTDSTVGLFLENGYRRNGNCMYSMRCPECKECVSIRLNPSQFQPNRNQRRVWKKNYDVAVGLAPVTMSDENLDLLERFLKSRFPNGRADAESYYNGFFITAMTRCFEIRYRTENNKLLGVAIIDCSDQWMNAVYFYFDPDQAERSPGTLNILYLIDFCRRHGIRNLYLGYWIKQLKGMEYKEAFRPHEILVNGTWQWVEK